MAPPKPYGPLSSMSTCLPCRTASLRADMDAKPAPTISTSVLNTRYWPLPSGNTAASPPSLSLLGAHPARGSAPAAIAAIPAAPPNFKNDRLENAVPSKCPAPPFPCLAIVPTPFPSDPLLGGSSSFYERSDVVKKSCRWTTGELCKVLSVNRMALYGIIAGEPPQGMGEGFVWNRQRYRSRSSLS